MSPAFLIKKDEELKAINQKTSVDSACPQTLNLKIEESQFQDRQKSLAEKVLVLAVSGRARGTKEYDTKGQRFRLGKKPPRIFNISDLSNNYFISQTTATAPHQVEDSFVNPCHLE